LSRGKGNKKKKTKPKASLPGGIKKNKGISGDPGGGEEF